MPLAGSPARPAGRHVPAPVHRAWARLVAHVPPEIGLLAAMCVGASVSGTLMALFPDDDRSTILAVLLAPVSLVLCVGLLVAGARTPRWVPHVIEIGAVLLFSLGIARAPTADAVMAIAWGYAWILVYISVFFSMQAALGYALLITVGCTAAVLVGGVPNGMRAVIIIVVTIWIEAIALARLRARLRAQAETDELTGLLNRKGFLRAAARERAIADRHEAPLSLALIDLDDFKRVNDDHGHAAGDQLLAALAAGWLPALRSGDLVARFGGDEFVLLFPQTTLHDASQALERLRAVHPARWSSGLTPWHPGESLDACLSRADTALYEAKSTRATLVPAAHPARS